MGPGASAPTTVMNGPLNKRADDGHENQPDTQGGAHTTIMPGAAALSDANVQPNTLGGLSSDPVYGGKFATEILAAAHSMEWTRY
jgi:hypothetical protein